MTKITENEFKKLDLEFRTRASRLCRARYQESKMLLSKFLYYVEHTPLLNDYVQCCSPDMSDETVKEMTENVIRGWGDVAFDFGNDIQQEVARQYRVLKYADDDKDASRLFAIGRAFDGDSHYQSSVDGFIHGVVTPFVDNLNLYLHTIAMNICSTSEKNIAINVHGDNAQINTAQGTSTINAEQINARGDWQFIAKELEKLHVAAEDVDELREILSKEKPGAKDNLGTSINQWILKIASKVSQGAMNLSMATASNVLAALVCRFYGI